MVYLAAFVALEGASWAAGASCQGHWLGLSNPSSLEARLPSLHPHLRGFVASEARAPINLGQVLPTKPTEYQTW
jgi:hypothetical protein